MSTLPPWEMAAHRMLEDTRGLLPALDGSVIVVTLIGSRFDRRGLQAMPYNVECRSSLRHGVSPASPSSWLANRQLTASPKRPPGPECPFQEMRNPLRRA